MLYPLHVTARRAALCAVLAAGCARSAAPPAARFAIDYTPPLAEADRTQITVLASPHLYALAGCLTPHSLDAVIDRLRAWHPDVIAVENMPAATVDLIEHRDDEFGTELRGMYPNSIDAGHAAQGELHVTATRARIELAGLDARAPAAEQRVHLVLLLAAAYDYPSAVLQWSYLDDAGRAAAQVPAALRDKLETSRAAPNEIYRIGVPLAQSLGLARFALVDDFGGEELWMAHADQFKREVDASPEASKQAPFYDEVTARGEAACRDPSALLAHYRWMNSPAYARADVAAQWGLWFRTHFASRLDRARYAAWEARNLAIASNLRKETTLHAGQRVLVIYGAGHKPFLDAYLAQLLDVREISSLDVLGP
ncbi:MAG TPA: DUF5694 domain-containing protein [Kofleriaceae bacterium]|nr:DUF5694 domain-containing protein [Kofleriaceae bacterium]